MKCLSIDRNRNQCRCQPQEDSRFCKFHQYMNSYDNAMIAGLEICSTCKKAYYLENCKICDNCKMRSKVNREVKKENVILCSKENCKYKRSVENKYCKLHQNQLFVDEIISENKKLCYNFIRGCREKLDLSYTFSKCQNCLSIEREKDKERRLKIKETNLQIVSNEENPIEKGCTGCLKILPIQDFIGIRKEETKLCNTCRENNRIQDMKRDKEHRNEIARVNDAKPERVEVKKQWKEDNYEKVAEYWMNSRQHKIEKIGVDEYWKNNAEQAKKWRDNNPDKVKENNENKINSIELQYGVYTRSAELKQLEFSISFEEYTEIVNKPCHYCGITHSRGFNGMDRNDNTKGYLFENCVSCCKMCNFMKNSLNGHVFVNRIEHILTYNKIIDGKLCPELFADHLSMYYKYKNRALTKHIEFIILPNEYKLITNQDCYLCGKSNTNTHKNGIDRYDNDIGYVLENCRPCCGECNYMKRNYSYNDLFDKFKMIYHYNNTKKEIINELEQKTKNNSIENTNDENITITLEEETENDKLMVKNNKCLVKGNKKSQEQIKEEARIKKQKQRESLKIKYGDEEYKKIHAKKIAEYRANKKNS